MLTIAEYTIQVVLELIKSKKKFKIETKFGTFYIKTNSVRLQNFAKSLKCVNCGAFASICLLQTQKIKESKSLNCHIDKCRICANVYRKPTAGQYETPHFNFYHKGKNGGLVLMTVDHIFPLSKGGKNCMDNTQIMCRNCNQFKSNKLPNKDLLEKWKR